MKYNDLSGAKYPMLNMEYLYQKQEEKESCADLSIFNDACYV